MKKEAIDNQVAELVEQVTLPLSADAKGRMLSGIARVEPTRVKPRRRLIAIAVGAAVVLFALGFVPLPAGSAKGALTRAMAAIEQLRTRHTIQQSWDEQGNEYLTETWNASDGFLRQDELKGDKLSHVWIEKGAWSLSFDVLEDGKLRAFGDFDPLGAYYQQHQVKLPLPEQSADMVGDTFTFLKSVDAYKNVTINEYQERTLWGGAINIAEVETDHGAPGHGQKWRFEIDPTTDRVMKEVFYVSSGTEEIWKEKSETYYEWDAPIPDSARDFAIPAGTKLTRDLWWQHKIDKVVAKAATPNGEVILHDVQVDNEGTIIATVSTQSIIPQFVVEDNLGNKYCSGNFNTFLGSQIGNNRETGIYHAFLTIPIAKTAGDSGEIPSSATFTFHPLGEEASNDPVAVLKDVPLPARQPLSMKEIRQKDSEVIQY